MPFHHIRFLSATALSGAALLSLPAQAATALPLWGFESGALTPWTGYGGTSTVASDTLDLNGTTFQLGAKGGYMAKILPDGSNVMRAQAETLLGLTAGTFANSGAAGLATSTNFGLITTSTYLAAGDYTFGWSYAAQDYAPYDDGVFFSLAGNGVSSVDVLASNFTGQADTVIVGEYGSTPWRVTTFTITTAGTYQLGFGAYNNIDTGVDPILYLDDGIGTLSADGVPVGPATPGLPVIDNQQPYYVITNVANGSIQPVFDGGTLLIDAAGTYTDPLTINGQGGTIDSNGLDATLAGNIDGTGGLTKTGAGTLTLTGTNSYTGGTTISGGTLAGNTTSLQGDIVDNATLEFAQATDGTYAGAISGSGSFVKSGAGTLTLTGVNSYTGGTTIAAGTLVGDTTSLQGGIVDNATLEFAQATDGTYAGAISGSGGLVKSGAGSLILTGTNSYTGGTTISAGTLVGNAASLQGDIVDNATLEFAQASDGSYGGAISGNGGFVKSGAGTLVLTGTNSYSGGTTVQGGKLVGTTASLQGNILNNATLEFAQASDGTFAGNLGGTGMLLKSGGGALTLSGTNEGLNAAVAGGKLVVASQQAIGTSGGVIALAGGTTLQANANLTISQILSLVSGGTASTGSATIDTGANIVSLTGGGTGNACLTKVGTGTLNVLSHVQNSVGACVQQGVMSFNNVFDGNVTVAAAGRIGGTGTINGSVVAKGMVAPGNSPGVLTVNGSVTQQAGSSLALDIDGPTAGNGAGHHDALVLTGAQSVYTAAGTIVPTLRGITGSATNSFTPTLGQTFEVVTAQGGVTGSFDGLTQPTSGLPANTRFDVIYRANALLLVVTPGLYSLMADTSNAAAAGGALDAIRPAAGIRPTTANPIFDRLSSLDATQIGSTLEQLSGSIHAATMDSTLQGNRAVRGTIIQHLKTERTDGLVTAPGGGIWGSVGNLDGTVHADTTGRGYKQDSQAYTIGFDFARGADWTIGVAGTYGQDKADAGALGTGKTDSYHGSLYAIWARGGSYATAQFGIGQDRYHIRRAAALTAQPSTLATDVHGMSYGLELEAGHRFGLGVIGVTPLLGLSHDRLSRGDVTEAGDTSVALTFDHADRTAWSGRAGLRLDSGPAIARGRVRAYATGAVVQELGDRSTSLTPSLQGAAFRIAGADAGRTAFQGEAGLTGALSSRIEVNVGYRYRSSDNAHADGVNGTLAIRW